MLVLVLNACAPPPLPDTSTDTDTGSLPPGRCASWSGDWDLEAECGGAPVGIAGTGTAQVTSDCRLAASVAFIGTDGACRLTERIELGEFDTASSTYLAWSTASSADPKGCEAEPEQPFGLVATVDIEPDEVAVSFEGVTPWLLGDCVGLSRFVLTPSTGTASR